MNNRLRWLACAPLVLVLTGCGFTGNLRMDPGFASFRTPATLRETDREVAVSLGPVPIRLATLISRPIFRDDDERWIPETLSTIRGVRVYIYEVKDDTGHVAPSAELVGDGGHPGAAVRRRPRRRARAAHARRSGPRARARRSTKTTSSCSSTSWARSRPSR